MTQKPESTLLEIAPAEAGIIRDILADALPVGCKVWVFGSRAAGKAHRGSDLDLALEGQAGPLPAVTLSRLRDAFTESRLPYTVDVLDLNAVGDDFRGMIRRQAVPFPVRDRSRPALRFRDDTGQAFPDWENSRLGDVAKVTTGSSNREDSKDVGEYAFFDRSNDKRWSSKFLFDCEAIIVAGEGKDFPPRYFQGKFDLHQRAYAITGFNLTSAKFLFYWIEWYRRHFLNFSVGSTMPSLRMAAFNTFPVSLPSLPEQRKIASFLSAVDRRIAVIERRREFLKQYKRGLMQKLFSRQIRFRDDNGQDFPDWQVKRIGDVFKVTRGQVLATSKITSNPDGDFTFPVYSSQTKSKGLMSYYKKYLFEDAITWTTDGNVGDVHFRTGKFYCTNVCGVLISSHGYANGCVAAILNQVTKRYVIYVGNPKLMNNVMGEIEIKFPSLPEQQKIASFLSAVDRRIAVLERRRVLLTQYRRGLMQKLFSRQIRFRDDNGQDFPDWEVKRLGEVTQKPLPA